MTTKVVIYQPDERKTFSEIRHSLECDEAGAPQPHLFAQLSGNVGRHEDADGEMAETAKLGRTKNPVLDLELIWRPKENVSIEKLRGAVALTLLSIDGLDRQWFAVAYRDPVQAITSLRLVVNRVSPRTYLAIDTWKIHFRLARSSEAIEKKYRFKRDSHHNWRWTLPKLPRLPKLAS